MHRVASTVGVAGATLVVVACTWMLRAPAVVTQLAAHTATDPGAAADFRAIVVFQLADCESALPWLRVFDEPAVRARTAVSGLVVGRGADVERAAARLEDAFRRVPVRAAGRRGALALRGLGFRATPYIVLLDRAGRVRFASPAPGRDDMAAFSAAVRAALEAP